VRELGGGRDSVIDSCRGGDARARGANGVETIEREDEEALDDGRRRCLNEFWAGAVGRKIAVSMEENRTEENS
jgi:hypothetical protein